MSPVWRGLWSLILEDLNDLDDTLGLFCIRKPPFVDLRCIYLHEVESFSSL